MRSNNIRTLILPIFVILLLLSGCQGAPETPIGGTPSTPAETVIVDPENGPVVITVTNMPAPAYPGPTYHEAYPAPLYPGLPTPGEPFSPYPAALTPVTPLYPAPPTLPGAATVYPGPATQAPLPTATAAGAFPATATSAAATLATGLPGGRTYTCDLTGSDLPVYTYEVIETYPHDSAAYTQGMIYRDGTLYEGTGLHGQSSLRQVELETGDVQEQVDLPLRYFGEGITELDGKLYQLTWQEYTGFVYDLETFEQMTTFEYDTEGWGLTHDGEQLILSDGTQRLYFIDPETLQVTGDLQVQDDRGPVSRINELEFVDGEVWGNLYQTACIARIDPDSGDVTGWIDLTGLYELAAQGQGGPVPPEVPNGIAYDPGSERLFVTGKFWPSLFEIELQPEEAE